MHGIALRRNIRLLSVDRPGFGLSTHDPDRRIADWPADVRALADRLGVDRFAVLGCSGGGPYALACAKELPREVLIAAGVLAGATVWDRGFWTGGMAWYRRVLYVWAKLFPAALGVVSDVLVGAVRWIVRTGPVERRIDAWLEAVTKAEAAKKEKDDDGMSLVSTATQDAGAQQEHVAPTAERRERLIGLMLEGFAQGTAGFVHETRLLIGDWGFKLEDITYDRVQIWHGSKDTNAPAEGMRAMAARIPHCEFKEYEENHYGMGKHVEEVLTELLPDSASSTARTGRQADKRT
jgi:pimeloyl-ACP methyl ester carboxylesterase